MRILGALLLALVALDAGAQGLTLFPASQYGKASLNLPQSTTGMSSVQLQNVLGRNANFERLDSYREQDRFRRIALPVGRLDLLVNGPMGSGVANCTASIISARHIITNNHCFPEGQGAVKQASLLMDFYSEDNEATAKRFEVKVVPVERNAELDFVIAEVAGNPSAIFGRIALEPRDPEPGESLLIIHHPMGMPKHMTRGGCRAHAPVAVQGTDIRHRCDTLPGSSGSPILSEGSGRMLGLHYGGSPNPGPNTWNFGKRLSEISGRSRVLAAAVAEQRQQEESASRSAAANADAERQRQETAMRAEIERRVKEQVEAERARDARAAAVAAMRPPPTSAPQSPAQPAVGVYSSQPREQPRSFRDCPVCPELVEVPLGNFVMGVAPGEEEAEDVSQQFRGRSTPQVQVRIPAPLAVGRMEVTRGEFAVFVSETGFATGSSCWIREGSKWTDRAGANWQSPGFSQADRHPVVCVSWDDAQAYVRWLSMKTGKGYRLLSEAEWEYAARAGGQTRRPWGDSSEEGCSHANIADAAARRLVPGVAWGTSCDDRYGYTAPVGTYRANAFGLHDMLGNVYEWVADCWNETHNGALSDGSARTTGDCSRRIVRGGSWDTNARLVRSAYRGRDPSGLRTIDRGFRIARTL